MLSSKRAKALASALASLLPACAVQGAAIDLSALSGNPAAATANTAAINTAISAAQSGDTIELPAGSYSISSTINLKTGVNVIGAGQGQTTLQFAGTTSEPIVMSDGASNVQLQGFTLDGANSTSASEGIAAQNCSGLNIDDVTVQNLTLNSDPNAEIGPQGIYFSATVTSSVIANSTFKSIGTNSNWGAGIRLAAGSNNNQVVNNIVGNTGRGGILLSDSSGNTVTGNTVSGSGEYPNGAGLGIEVQGSANSLIQNNTVDHWISVDTSSGSAVRGNVVSDTSGIYKAAGLELVNSQNVVFSHNVVNGGADVGISVSGNGVKSQIYFGHNTINASDAWGAQVQGGTDGASEMYFKSNTFTGSISDPNGAFANQGVGFRFNGNAHFITLDNNTISSNQFKGVEVGGGNVGNLTFNNTTIENNGDVAVDQDGGLSDVQWTNTTASGNGYSNAIPTSAGNQPQPVVTINASTTLALGAVGTFSLQFVEAGGSLGNVLWDFGDGLPATSATTTHTFSLPGVYDVAVVVWDQTGYASEAEFDVTVAPEPTSLGLLGVGVGVLILKRRHRSRI